MSLSKPELQALALGASKPTDSFEPDSFQPDSFEPDAPESDTETEAAPVNDDPGLVSTIAGSLARGGLKNWDDNAGGALVEATVKPGIGKTKEDMFNLGQANVRKDRDAQHKHHPILAPFLEGVGDMATDYLISKTGVPVGSVPYQTISGAVQGMGASDAELGSLPSLASGAGGGALGYIGGKYAGPLLEKGAGALAKYFGGALEGPAAKLALKAAGFSAGDVKALLHEAKDVALQQAEGLGKKETKALLKDAESAALQGGRDLLDEGVLKAGTKVDDTATSLARAVEEQGQKMRAPSMAPGARAAASDAARKHASFSEALGKAKDKMTTDAKKSSGWMDALSGIGAAVIPGHVTPSSLLGGLATAGATKLARTRGASTAAVGTDIVSKFLQNPDALGKFGEVLAKTGSREGLLAMDSVLQAKFPEYKALRDQLLGAPSESPDAE